MAKICLIICIIKATISTNFNGLEVYLFFKKNLKKKMQILVCKISNFCCKLSRYIKSSTLKLSKKELKDIPSLNSSPDLLACVMYYSSWVLLPTADQFFNVFSLGWLCPMHFPAILNYMISHLYPQGTHQKARLTSCNTMDKVVPSKIHCRSGQCLAMWNFGWQTLV